MKNAAADSLCLIGLAAVLFGIYQIYAPLTWIVGGVIVAGTAVAMAKEQPK